MPESLCDILVVSDMDGTLLDSQCRLAPSDIETIRLFTLLGGHFTVATGRTYASIKMYPELVKVIKPAITCGGAVLYDFNKEEPAKSEVLPHLSAKKALRDILAAFPALGAMVMCNDMRLYEVAASSEIQLLIESERMSYFTRPAEDLPDEWNKVLFAGSKKLLHDVESYVQGRTYPGVYFISTNDYYYEMMPKGVSKGSALHELCILLDIPIKNTIVIGDYYNDLDIMKQAGYAVAMRNAPQGVRDAAREVIDSNDNGGVGQYLYRIINKYE